MDNLTHSLVGVMLARAGLSRGQKGSTAMVVLAANAPDIDTYNFFTDSLAYLEVHRGYTHALAFIPLVALVPLAIVRGITRTRPTLFEWIACMVAVLSHQLLDWTNVYGVRLLLPFSGEWRHLDITNIIDPVILLLLLAAVAAPALVKLVTSEIAGRGTRGPVRGWAVFALVSLLFYEGARLTAHDRAVGELNARLYMGEPAQQVFAFPDTFSPLQWRGVVYGEGFIYEAPLDLTRRFDLSYGEFDYQPHDAPALDAARTTRVFQVFERFNQAPSWRLSPLVDIMRVELYDLRFGSLRRPGFTATALVEPDGRIAESSFSFGR
jgi:inner membrane protein